MNVTLTFACKTWEDVQALQRDAVEVERRNPPGTIELMHIEVEK